MIVSLIQPRTGSGDRIWSRQLIPRAEDVFVGALQVHIIALLSTVGQSPMDEADSVRSDIDHDVGQMRPPVCVGEQ